MDVQATLPLSCVTRILAGSVTGGNGSIFVVGFGDVGGVVGRRILVGVLVVVADAFRLFDLRVVDVDQGTSCGSPRHF